MINSKFIGLALSAAAACASSVAFAQTSSAGGSGSPGFQIGGLTTANNASSASLSTLVPVSGGLFSIGSSGQAAITQIAGAGAFTGPGTYVLTDGAGNTVTVVVGADGTITSISDGEPEL